MSMLSNEDILRELGENIYIHPLNLDNVRGNSINLTTSNIAWSLKTHTSIICKGENGDEIIIPANDTALIETKEVIYVTEKIGGTYHSRVSIVSKGIGHIGTTLDPGWIGQSLIAIHNHSDEEYRMAIGQSFVSLVLYYNNTKATYKNTNKAGQLDVLIESKITPTNEEMNQLKEEWRSNTDKLKDKMLNSNDYRDLECNRKINLEKEKDMKRKSWPHKFKIMIAHISPIIIFVSIAILVYLFEVKNSKGDRPVFNYITQIGLSGFAVYLYPKAVDYIKNKVERSIHK
ncbi:MAG TPA: deoxycytidine triphosphate deaminase [Lachnospiraceae bacterium]|nr:deoxycytidine triphosphate deaminase [Lachnospiraceae bacterium]